MVGLLKRRVRAGGDYGLPKRMTRSDAETPTVIGPAVAAAAADRPKLMTIGAGVTPTLSVPPAAGKAVALPKLMTSGAGATPTVSAPAAGAARNCRIG
jgi:hypothetical protein